MSLAVDLQREDTHDLAQRRFNRKNPGVTDVYPTHRTSLKPIIVVFGAGAAGVSFIEVLPVGVYDVILVEKEELHRGGNVVHISGDHESMHDAFLHRFQSVLGYATE